MIKIAYRWPWALGAATMAAFIVAGCAGDETQSSSAGGGGSSTTSSSGQGGESATASSTGGQGGGGQGGGGQGGGGQGGGGQGGGEQGGGGQGGSGQGGSGQGGGGSEMISVDGKLTPGPGKMVPAEADVIVGWSVSSGSPDYVYSFGAGKSTNQTFKLDLTKAPPPEALNSYGVGVGLVLLYPTGMSPPEGKIPNQMLDQASGATGDYAIIFKAPNAPNQPWISDFPPGYSCGKGAPPVMGSNFESFTPVDCGEILITVDDINNIDFVNWT